MADIILDNYVAVAMKLRDHEVICALMEEKRIFTRCNSETILASVTSAGKTYALYSIIRTRSRRAFPWLCVALDRTMQVELLDILDPLREVLHSVTPAVQLPAPRRGGMVSNECCVCLDAAFCVLYLPCSHLCCCAQCSRELSLCPVCRVAIENKLPVYT